MRERPSKRRVGGVRRAPTERATGAVRWHPIASLLLALATSAPPTLAVGPVAIEIYAAASLRDALTELAPALERAAGVRAVLNLGASSDLARQIVAAHRADLFVSADEAWMDHVAAAGLVDGAWRRSPLSNRLVVVVPKGSELEIRDAEDLAGPGIRRLALAHPDVVPAGRYARAWLAGRGQWAAIADRVIPALDVRAALAAVESGAVDAAVVYRTDAAAARRVRVAFEVSAGEGPPIAYSIAPIAGRPHLERARAAVDWLCGPDARAVFERHGFLARSSPP